MAFQFSATGISPSQLLNVKTHLSGINISFNQFYCLTNVGDLQDLIPAFHDKSMMGPNCNGYIKLLNNKIYVTQATHNIYSFLLRIFKTYEFPTKD